jgi:hypothetical protein
LTTTTDDNLPAVPRPITARGRRRAWVEQPVRVWMILCALLLVGIGYVLVDELPDGIAERRIIYHGQQVTATLKDIGEVHDGDTRHTVRTDASIDERTVTLVYPGGPPDGSMRVLETSRFQDKRPGDLVDIRFDKLHPEDWTDRTEPLPWSARLTIVWMLLPMLVVTVGMMLFRKQQLLRIWRQGQPTVATVVDSRQSAIAPRSQLIRYTIDDSADRRVYSTFFPNAAGSIEKGDQIMMLALPEKPGRAIVAGLYS